jgi:hypothetical protein
MATRFQVVIDCAEPASQAEFWAAALGYIVQPPPEGFDSWEAFLTHLGVPETEWGRASAVVDPAGTGPRIFFQRVPEAKATKNRVHLDLNVGGSHGTPADERKRRIEAEVERLSGLRATVVDRKAELAEYWVVMRDPEGNEFCVQ